MAVPVGRSCVTQPLRTTSRVGGMVTTHRFQHLSSHLFDLTKAEHGTNWGGYVASRDSHFKVLDIWAWRKTQILLTCICGRLSLEMDGVWIWICRWTSWPIAEERFALKAPRWTIQRWQVPGKHDSGLPGLDIKGELSPNIQSQVKCKK